MTGMCSEQMLLEKGIDGLARHRVATNFQFVKNTVPVKCSKTRYTCIAVVQVY